jgi:antitoxin MazE
MRSHIQKWGNSLGVRIPMHLAKKLNLHPGSSVNLEIEDQRLVIEAPRYHLDDMLAEITSSNLHHEIFDNDMRGNEEW